jgi:hypothetical protein
MEFILLKSFSNYMDAHMLLGRMSEEGIECWLKDENTVTLDPLLTNAVGGIKLMVARNDFEKASALLLQYQKEKRMNLSCPKCKSHDIDLVTSPRKASTWLGAFVGFFTMSLALPLSQDWHCFQCGNEFKEPIDNSVVIE